MDVDAVVTEVASSWVDSPYAGQALPGGKAVVVTGQACTFEANVVRLPGAPFT